MEIEAKFTVPNRRLYSRLARLSSLAGYGLVSIGSAQVSDDYFDTSDRRLLAAGYACRLRREGDMFVATLKGLGGVEGAVHRRAEHEVRLATWTSDVVAWPESAARALALELTGAAPLERLFGLVQTRFRADLVDRQRRVAQLSLDAVQVAIGQRPAAYYELEVEIAADGAEADLAAVVSELATVWKLAPEPRSKFERALALLDAGRGDRQVNLSPEERTHLEGYAAGADVHLASRAKAILGRADGLPTREIVARSGLSPGRVRFWLRAFRARRLAIFAHAVSGQAEARAGSPPPKEGERPAESPARSRRSGEHPATRPKSQRAGRAAVPAAPLPSHPPASDVLPTVIDFVRRHGVDMAHAKYVAGEAVALFNALKPTHCLPRKRRKLLRQAAFLCTVGAATDPERPAAAGRDLILAQPLRNVSTADRLALACIVAFQRDKVKPERELTLTALEERQQNEVLALSALLHMAEALDFSRSQKTRVRSVEGADSKHCEVAVDGPQAAVDAHQAASRTALWYQLFSQELVFVPAESDAPPAPAVEAVAPVAVGPVQAAVAATAPVLPNISPLRPDDPMSEAGRKVLYTHFTRMLANEAGTRLGEDIEALHDMRVATRRMRAAYRIFAVYFEEKAVSPFNKALQRTGRMLGAVRDLDVLLEKAVAYQAGLLAANSSAVSGETGSQAAGTLDQGPRSAPSEGSDSLEPLLADWRTRREVARRQMLEYLDSAAYRQFVSGFKGFLATPGAGALPIAAGEPVPHQVRHVAPRLIYTRYEAVRAYEPILEGAPLTTYHRLRIDFKGLRYALEFFRDVLGPEAPDVIKTVVTLQDLLGALQDAYVAEGLLKEFLEEQRTRRKKKAAATSFAGIEGYLAAQRAVQQELLVKFPALWANVVGTDFRRALALAVAAL